MLRQACRRRDTLCTWAVYFCNMPCDSSHVVDYMYKLTPHLHLLHYCDTRECTRNAAVALMR